MSFNPQQFSYPSGPAAGSYGGYPSVDPEIQQWFSAVDLDKSGKISAKELQSALVNGQGKNFNIAVCELLVSMFSKETPGVVNVTEFQYLYKFVNQWLQTFRSFDKDQSGVIEEEEVSQAFQQMGFRFTNEFIKFLIAKADKIEKKKISVDQFILICIQIQRFTDLIISEVLKDEIKQSVRNNFVLDAFRARDTELKGVITVGFEDFLTIALSCSS